MRTHLSIASALAYLLDNQFKFGRFRFGFSALLDLIPGIGNILDTIFSLYIVWIAVAMRVPSHILLRMIGNIFINFIFGLIPILGDAIYVFRKVNIKNVALLKQYAPSSVIEGEIIR